MRQSVFINLLQMPVPQEAMEREACFADVITKRKNAIVSLHALVGLCLLRLFAANQIASRKAAARILPFKPHQPFARPAASKG